jgi:hypothetical protein
MALGALVLGGGSGVQAQTDFHGLDKGRPLRVEDAFASKFRSLELKASPLSLLRTPGAEVAWHPSLELKAGLFPGLEASVGIEGISDPELEISALLNLWREGVRAPAAGLRVVAHAPFGDEPSSLEVRGMLTRSLGGPFRVHVNGGAVRSADETTPWVGTAFDWVLPFRHTLLLGEVWTQSDTRLEMMVPEGGLGTAVENRIRALHAMGGFRFQQSATTVVDAGVGHTWRDGASGEWTLRVGLTREFGLSGWRGTPPATPRAPHPGTAPILERVQHPYFLPAAHVGAFRDRYGAADRLFNAFDYGHGVLYETLWRTPDAPVSLLEETLFAKLVEDILPSPPRLPMPEASFMPTYVQMAPRAKEMFEWAHLLHRQSYDILADPSLDEAARDRAIEALIRHYESSDLAFTSVPKGMEVMDGQYFSKAFRERYPRFNGLIWAYHWLQMAVYEPLLVLDDPADRQAAIQATVARFWQMVAGPEGGLPTEMPMTPAIAPVFTERYPRLAAIFDNLHMMHDVISDILVSDEIQRGSVRAEIYRQIGIFTDPNAMGTSDAAWIAMSLAHGVDAQGGPALGWLPPVPTRSAVGGGHDHHDHEP